MWALVLALVLTAAPVVSGEDACPGGGLEPTLDAPTRTESPASSQDGGLRAREVRPASVARVRSFPPPPIDAPTMPRVDARRAARRIHVGHHVPRTNTEEPPAA